MNAHPHGENLSAYIDDMLDVAQMRAVAVHLRTCESCRTSLASLKQTRDLLHAMDAPPALPADFWTNTYRRVRVEGAAPGQALPLGEQVRRALLGTQRRWAAGVAAVAVLGAVIAAPMVNHDMSSVSGGSSYGASGAADVVDFPALVRDHAQSAARQPLADSDRQTMLSADIDDVSAADDAGAEAAGNASITTDSSP